MYYEGTVTSGAAVQYAHKMTETEARGVPRARLAGAVAAGYVMHPEREFADRYYVQGYRSTPIKVRGRVKMDHASVTILVKIIDR